MYGNELNQYLFELSQHIRRQDETIHALEKRIEILETEIKNKPGTTIEKVEYKFDQLKVETLSGTLHIGISPETIEDIAVQQPLPNNVPPLKQQLEFDLQGYLQENGTAMIRNISSNHGVAIQESDYTILLQDIGKQIPNRIAFYEQEAMKQHISNETDVRKFIKSKIIEEFHLSLTNYMRKKGEE